MNATVDRCTGNGTKQRMDPGRIPSALKGLPLGVAPSACAAVLGLRLDPPGALQERRVAVASLAVIERALAASQPALRAALLQGAHPPDVQRQEALFQTVTAIGERPPSSPA